MIQHESIQQVIHRADIVEVIGHFINVKRRGANYIANCPFHNEKTPSFNINPAKGIYKCFGCGKGGDVVSFVEEYEKFSFVEAIRWLATFYHIDLVETEDTNEVKQVRQVEESLRILNEFATNYFQNNLSQSEEGQLIGASYFRERGFTEHTIQKFKLGYALDQRDAFLQAAIQHGFTQDILEKSGIVKFKDGSAYDNYRGRVIFPIFSNTGKVLGFGARILKKNDRAPKYVNTPENELYVKNKVLYGLYQSRQPISQLNECLLVEGYTDVISLHQSGIENVVASSGTSLTIGQLKLISNLTKNLTILYDGDAAGIKAAVRGLEMALVENFTIRIVLLPEGEDPDSFVQKVGADNFRQYIETHRQDIIEFMISLGNQEEHKDPIKKSALINEIAEVISKIDKTVNFSLQQHYIHQTATQLDIDEAGFVGLVNKFIRDRVTQEKRQQERQIISDHLQPNESQPTDTTASLQAATQLIESNTQSVKEWQIIKMLLEYGDLPYDETSCVAQYFFEEVDLDLFEDKMAFEIATMYHSIWYETKQFPNISVFINHNNPLIKKKIAELFNEKYFLSENWKNRHNIDTPMGQQVYLEDVESSIEYFRRKIILEIIISRMKELKNTTDYNKIIELMRFINLLKAEEKKSQKIIISSNCKK